MQLSRTKVGSQVLQKQLLKGHPSAIKGILDEMEPELPGLMCHMHGNYLCSAAFQSCSVTQRVRMLEASLQKLPAIAKDQWGTHALQALVGLVCSREEEALLVPALERHLEELGCHVHGTHVVQRALVAVGTPLPEAILRRVVQCLPSLAHSPHGICVLKTCISQTRRGAGMEVLAHSLASRAPQLAGCPYGNYAVQHAMEAWGSGAAPIIRALSGHLVPLSCQKFSSKVVETALCAEPEDVRLQVFAELAGAPQALMSTVYGRYVARQMLRCAPSEEQRAALERSLMASLASLRNPRLSEQWETLLRDDDAALQDGAAADRAAARAPGEGAEGQALGPRRRGQKARTWAAAAAAR